MFCTGLCGEDEIFTAFSRIMSHTFVFFYSLSHNVIFERLIQQIIFLSNDKYFKNF